jgi:hypothetical protein
MGSNHYVERENLCGVQGRMMAANSRATIRTPHIKEVPIQQKMESSPFFAEQGLL